MHKIQTYIVSKFEEVGDKIVLLCFMVICLHQLSAYHHNFIYWQVKQQFSKQDMRDKKEFLRIAASLHHYTYVCNRILDVGDKL